MHRLTRLLITLVVATFAAQPVMACCLTGHKVALVAVERAELPCHGDTHDTAAQVPDSVANASSSQLDCPGCLDCDSLMMAVQAPDYSGVLTASTPETAVAMAPDMGFAGFEPQLPTLATGPPPNVSLPLRTPISLKQRLLI
ncbi:MAG: hypothetical protein FP825_15395 [Hyphomonas sp.]|jgi:hypothetical protein|uniref:hypothetical protein n=1 Tax=Hyphomonas sp. TaxID=87 RepID=UPI0017CFEADC|nr:hypothetical protein [Hyphomonas sp.]MBA3069855.1 hypothetical protein [Hyphomonas sp.]MBU3921367.1 hypothetical protein [Alphaproteobacteria bacterium]MBU4063543.1 hypothetical protein [Alphaproteobacteria bacterium]MBU4162782.1 hypothetical protein [Alphaproteobacteria bacterium]